MDYTWVVWLILAIVFLILEIGTVALVSAWFVVGSVVALIASLLGASIGIQIVLFIVVSLALIALFYSQRDRFSFAPKNAIRTNADRLIGEVAEVIKEVDPIDNIGKARVAGQIWSCSSVNHTRIPVGSLVKIVSIQGVRLVVELA